MRINSKCIICKGRDPKKYCGRQQCPIILKSQAIAKVKEIALSDGINADSPSVFVGHYGYPKLNIGFLTPPEKKENTWIYDAPLEWAKKEFKIEDVVGYRSLLINSRFKANVSQPVFKSDKRDKLIEIGQEITQASKPVDLEVGLEEKPKFATQFDAYSAPMGPNAMLKNVNVTSNPKIDRHIDKRVSDTDLLSNQAIIELYNKGYDENFLMKLLSMGNLGKGKDRKLVPTRWSITAVDDNVVKDMLKEIRDYEQIEPTLFFGGYLGNYYVVMMFEDVWQYELFETYMPNASWNQEEDVQFTTDYEGYEGRKEYAYNCAGGYYATRLPIIEFLKKEKKQASVLALRFITGEYSCPLGVWVVREATKKALSGKRHIFETKEQMIGYAGFIVKKKFGYDIDNLIRESKIHKNIRTQTKLSAYFT
jgi:DNA repair protein NreA